MSHPFIPQVIELVRAAGAATLPYWRSGVAVTEKSDASPVTAADLAAHHILLDGLQALAPEVPVLSEEAADIPLAERAAWTRWWLVDPLDGTKEFIAGSEEFTVNVALIERGRVVFGVVGIPPAGAAITAAPVWVLGAAICRVVNNRFACVWRPLRASPWWPASVTPVQPKKPCSPVWPPVLVSRRWPISAAR